MPVKKTKLAKKKAVKPVIKAAIKKEKGADGNLRSIKNMVEWDPKKKVWKDLISGEIIMEGKPDLIPGRHGLDWETSAGDTRESLSRITEKLREIADEAAPTFRDVVDPNVDSARVVDAAMNPKPKDETDLEFSDLTGSEDDGSYAHDDTGRTAEDSASIRYLAHEAIRRYVAKLVIDALR